MKKVCSFGGRRDVGSVDFCSRSRKTDMDAQGTGLTHNPTNGYFGVKLELIIDETKSLSSFTSIYVVPPDLSDESLLGD